MNFPDMFRSATPAGRYDASSIEVLEGLEPVRKRPGMYIGGTDEQAMHHLVAEVLDNAMDEAVAGFATRIEIEFHADDSVTIRDNGRGIPIDPHPKFDNRSALEIILCTLHAGAKFSGKTYRTSGGLHGVGVSVVNALSDRMTVEVVRDQQKYVQEFARGEPTTPLTHVSAMPNRRGTCVSFHPDPQIFPKRQKLSPRRIYRMARSKAFLFSGLEIRWKSETPCGEIPQEATFRFPRGLPDYLDEKLNGQDLFATSPFAGKVDFADRFGNGKSGSVEWAINWSNDNDGFIQSYCNTIPTSEGGTHENGFWHAIVKGLRAYGELLSNRKSGQILRNDVQSGGCAVVSCFIQEPEFVGQTKGRLATTEAHRLVENSIRDRFDIWLASDQKTSGNLLESVIERSEDRLRRKAAKEASRKSPTKRLRLPGKLVDCSQTSREGTEIFIVEGDSAGGSAKMARDRRTQALLPLRGKILNVLGASSSKLNCNAEIANLCQALGTDMGKAFDLDGLRYEKVIIMTDADVDGAHIASLLMTFFFVQMFPLVQRGHLYLACPPLFKLVQGAKRIYALDEEERDQWLSSGLGGKGKIEVSRFKGLGEMDAKDLRETTMNPVSRKLIRISIDDDVPGETEKLVRQLMGKKPAHRYRFIQANAREADILDL